MAGLEIDLSKASAAQADLGLAIALSISERRLADGEPSALLDQVRSACAALGRPRRQAFNSSTATASAKSPAHTPTSSPAAPAPPTTT